jgi:hypothetical protein
MQMMSRLETMRNDPRATMKLHALIADLRWRVQLLDSDVHEEEKKSGVFDACNVAYSTLARNLRARRDNLLGTITMLESQLVETGIAA